MITVSPVILLALLPALVVAQDGSGQRKVSLLVDQARYSDRGNVTVRSVLDTINQKKRLRSEDFYFGSTIANPSLHPENAEWTDARFR